MKYICIHACSRYNADFKLDKSVFAIHRTLRDFAFELSPVVSDIYNSTLRQGKIPELLKS